jgi:hypothetical protein
VTNPGLARSSVHSRNRTRVLSPPSYLFGVSPAYLQTKLNRPLPTKDGGTLRTVLDARTYMLALSQDREHRAQWQRACELLLAAAFFGYRFRIKVQGEYADGYICWDVSDRKWTWQILREYPLSRFVSCGRSDAQSVAVFNFELIDTSLEGAIRGGRADEQDRLARLSDHCDRYSDTLASFRSSISRQSQTRRRQATFKPAVAAICVSLNA